MKISGFKEIKMIDTNLSPSKVSTQKSFKDVLFDFVGDVNSLQNNANESINKLATGEIKDVHQVMMAMQEANLSFEFMMQTRNKLLAAYKEVLRNG